MSDLDHWEALISQGEMTAHQLFTKAKFKINTQAKQIKELEDSRLRLSVDYDRVAIELTKLQKEKAGLEEACRMAKNMVDGDTKMDTLRLLEALAQADKTDA